MYLFYYYYSYFFNILDKHRKSSDLVGLWKTNNFTEAVFRHLLPKRKSNNLLYAVCDFLNFIYYILNIIYNYFFNMFFRY